MHGGFTMPEQAASPWQFCPLPPHRMAPQDDDGLQEKELFQQFLPRKPNTHAPSIPMKKSALLLPALGFCLPALQAEVIATSTFANAASTDGWTAVTNSVLTSGQADAAFVSTPVLKIASASGAPAGNNSRASLSFPAATLDATDEYLEVKFQLRVATSYASSADRRFQACFWDSSTSDGYLAYVRAAGTSLTSQFVKQLNVPATGVMNSGGTMIAATGDTTQPLGSSQTVVHQISYRLLRTATGLELKFTGTDDTAVTRVLTGADASPLSVFDRLDLTYWGSTVNFHIDNVEVSSGIYVPPPPDGVWDGEGTDEKWSTPGNWVGDTVPAAGAGLVFGPAVSEVGVNDFPAATAFNNLIFANGAVNYDLAGNPITLTGKMENSSPLGQALRVPVILGGNLALEAAAGDLYLDGAISGDHGLVKGGTRLALLTGANTFTGPITINQGRLELQGDQSGVTGGFSVNNTVACAFGILPDTVAAVAAGKEIVVGTTPAGTAAATLDVGGSLANAGELKGLRGSTINVTGTFAQSGPARLEAVGGYAATLKVLTGGSFVFSGTDTFKLNSAPSNFAAAQVQVDAGVFTTGRGFANATAVTASTTAGIVLQNQGTLKFSADVPDLLTAVVANSAIFQMGAGGGRVETDGHAVVLNLPVSGTGSLTKAGTGTFTTTAVNSYTGDTIVEAGTLSLAGPNLADASAVTVATGAILNLSFAGSDSVAGLQLGDTVLAPGTYSPVTHPAFLTGTGSIRVANPDPFTDWINAFATLVNAADKEKSADPDNDGLPNIVEFALDGNPASGTASGKVMTKVEAGHLTLTLPVLAGATFSGTGPMTAEANGYSYRIDGGTSLSGFTAGVEEVTALSPGMPALSAGWVYRSFRLTAVTSAEPKGFLRADITQVF